MKTPEQIDMELQQILAKIGFEQISYAEAHDLITELFRTERLTDEQIDAMFPERPYLTDIGLAFMEVQRQAARQVRDYLQGKGGEGV